MRIWQRWFGKGEHHEETEYQERRMGHSTKHEEAQLRTEIRQLLQRRHALEQRGCFSDRELEQKERELEALDQRITAVKNQQFRLRTQKIRL